MDSSIINSPELFQIWTGHNQLLALTEVDTARLRIGEFRQNLVTSLIT